jgi:hypothetical protein
MSEGFKIQLLQIECHAMIQNDLPVVSEPRLSNYSGRIIVE